MIPATALKAMAGFLKRQLVMELIGQQKTEPPKEPVIFAVFGYVGAFP